MTGAITDNRANESKFKRLRKRQYITEDNKVNIMMIKGDSKDFFKKIPPLDENLKKQFAKWKE